MLNFSPAKRVYFKGNSPMIRCACLVIFNYKHKKIMLVRVRNNLKWYLPGGKIEPSETPQQALIRETKEELNIEIIPPSLKLLTIIHDKAYGIDDNVELHCFTAKYKGIIHPMAEISELRKINWYTEQDLIAPAVIKLCQYLENTYKHQSHGFKSIIRNNPCN